VPWTLRTPAGVVAWTDGPESLTGPDEVLLVADGMVGLPLSLTITGPEIEGTLDVEEGAYWTVVKAAEWLGMRVEPIGAHPEVDQDSDPRVVY